MSGVSRKELSNPPMACKTPFISTCNVLGSLSVILPLYQIVHLFQCGAELSRTQQKTSEERAPCAGDVVAPNPKRQ